MASKYNGKRLIPSPFLQISKNYNTSADGTVFGSLFNINLEGKFIIDRGSPTSSGTFWTAAGYPPNETANTNDVNSWLGILINKQEALRNLFATPGQDFVVEGYNGSGYLECNPRVVNIEFPRGNTTSWANLEDYRITLEADTLYLNGQTYGEDQNNLAGQYKIETGSEDWNVEIDNPDLQLFRLTHQISAKGKQFYSTSGTLDKAAWQNAKDWVISKLGINYTRLLASGVLDNVGVSGYNYLRGERLNEYTGEYSVNESWLCFNPSGGGTPAYDEFDVDARTDLAGVTQVSVKGKVQGLEERNNSNRALIRTKYDNAKTKFSAVETIIFSRASGFANTALNIFPLNYSIGRNPLTGVITYNYDYDNRPTSSVSGVKQQKISVSWDNATAVYAEIYVIGRAAGPVLQSIGTQTPSKKTINVDAKVLASTQTNTAVLPDYSAVISALAPSATTVFISQDRINFDENSGNFSRIVTYTYSN